MGVVEKLPFEGQLIEVPPALRACREGFAGDVRRHLRCSLGQTGESCTRYSLYQAVALALRDRLVENAALSQQADLAAGRKRVFYLSMEFLIGRLLGNAAMSLQVEETVGETLQQLGMSLKDLAAEEEDAGLGNGGLGRLAACFLDSCASLDLPVTGHGIRYKYGLFRQRVENGYQVEEPDRWLSRSYPWQIRREELARRVPFYGHCEGEAGERRWLPAHEVLAVPHDVMVPGYGNGRVNVLRLWSAEGCDRFDLDAFNAGDFLHSVRAKNEAEEISLVLYPNDHSEAGRQLRVRQQFFLASAALQDVLAEWVRLHGEDFREFAEQHCFQLNDTHPVCAIAEMMRLLIDEHGQSWDAAWATTRACMAYTNHTLLPEALECWPVGLLSLVLPRIMEIIEKIDRCFRAEVASRWPDAPERVDRMAIISGGEYPVVRMAHLGVVGSFSVNGVAALHSRLLAEGLFADFSALWPNRFNNKTNGVTHRRWLHQANPGLSGLIRSVVGDRWLYDLEVLGELRNHADDDQFQAAWARTRTDNKQALATFVLDRTGVEFDAGMLFDIQVKRIHEYKRQLLNILHVIHRYARYRSGDGEALVPRCVLIGGKAAPGYGFAKLVIKLANSVAARVNTDPTVAGRLRMAFLPNYDVSSMKLICPGTDLSEQISTAGMEASGTGNMKFMMNGALTIGTLDGANVEMLEAVGPDNFFLFGLTVEQVKATRAEYQPSQLIAADAELAVVVSLVESDHFCPDEPGLFRPIVAAITCPDEPWLTAADFRSYIDAQQRVDALYQQPAAWLRTSILNTACSGRFSSDRTIREYAREIWGLSEQP